MPDDPRVVISEASRCLSCGATARAYDLVSLRRPLRAALLAALPASRTYP